MPPVMAFNMGSLGFLTPFSFHDFKGQVTQVLEGMHVKIVHTVANYHKYGKYVYE